MINLNLTWFIFILVCKNDFGEGDCVYQCLGLGYHNGRCTQNTGNKPKCQCTQDQKYWEDLTFDVENDYKNSVCNKNIDENEKCSRYCWRFYRSEGKCLGNSCQCSDTDHSDVEIENNIYELCEHEERSNIDCLYKCIELGHENGTCTNDGKTYKKCQCENCDGLWNLLSKNDFYDQNNNRKGTE